MMPFYRATVGVMVIGLALITNCKAEMIGGAETRGKPSLKAHVDSEPRAAEQARSTMEQVPLSDLSSTQENPSRAFLRNLIEKEAAGTGLSPAIAESVMEVESGYNPQAVGSSGEIGLMQVMPSTARMMGFDESMSALAQPETNIHYGVTYLAAAWRLAGGDLCTALMKYRAGHGETRFSPLSVDYCLAVRSKLRARGFPVTGIVPVANFLGGAPSRLRLSSRGCRRGCIGGGGLRPVDFASLNAKLSAIVGQMRTGRD